MLIDVLLHLVPELCLEAVASEVSVVLWMQGAVSLVEFSGLKSCLPCLRHSILTEIEESLILLMP